MKRAIFILGFLLVFMAGCKTTSVIPNTAVTEDCTRKLELWYGQKGEQPTEVWQCYDWVIRSQYLDNQ